MSDFIEQLEGRINKASQDLERLDRKLEGLMVEKTRIMNFVDGLRKVLLVEKGENHSEESAPVKKSSEQLNKTDFIRKVVLENANQGVTPGEIYRVFRDSGIKLNRSYVYNVLNRLDDKGEVEKREGRVYPTESILRS